MGTCENLQAARKLIENPKNWTKSSYHNVEKRFLLPDKHTYCLLGAINVGRGEDPRAWCSDSLEVQLVATQIKGDGDVGRSLTDYTVYSFNDFYRTTHADVLQVLDKAIETCQNPNTQGEI